MINFQDLFKKQNQNQLILTVVLIIYILFDVPTPNFIAPFINNIFGQVVVVLIAIMLLVYYNPILGVLGLFTAFLLIRKSSSFSSSINQAEPVNTESEKRQKMEEFNVNENAETLEIDMVNNMTPLVSNLNFSNPSYKPVLEDNIKGGNL